MKSIKEIKNMTDEELAAKLSDLQKELFQLRFNHATNQLANPMQLVACRKDIARVKTVIRERELQKA